MTQLTIDEAIRRLRSDPDFADQARDSYFDRDVYQAAERFRQSAEWATALALVTDRVRPASVLDLGAGAGIASYAFVRSGTRRAFALEPDPSDEVGCGALARLPDGLPIHIVRAVGEAIPLENESIDVVYARQVLHHTRDLPLVLRECARVLRPGGVFLACREHVVDDARQLAEFLRRHPVHQLTGGENAYRLDQYVGAIRGAGFELQSSFGPWDSVINAFPEVRSQVELDRFAATLLARKLGVAGRLAAHVPGVQALVWRRVKRRVPGRLYSFLAVKPG
jgi:ubiquinone/menaquinone biosynthesis C-methylase UbiE